MESIFLCLHPYILPLVPGGGNLPSSLRLIWKHVRTFVDKYTMFKYTGPSMYKCGHFTLHRWKVLKYCLLDCWMESIQWSTTEILKIIVCFIWKANRTLQIGHNVSDMTVQCVLARAKPEHILESYNSHPHLWKRFLAFILSRKISS